LLLAPHDAKEARTGGDYVGASEIVEDALGVAKKSRKRLTVAAIADSAPGTFREAEQCFEFTAAAAHREVHLCMVARGGL
jgi:hypothetical protein